MNFVDKFFAWWKAFSRCVRPVLGRIGMIFRKIKRVLEAFITGVFKVRKIIAAIPVGIGAVYLALYNLRNLPEVVGIGLLEDGSFIYQIPSGIAVFTPLAVTGVCVLLMFCSRRILTPWLVSVFSLIIPVFILITNIFPA